MNKVYGILKQFTPIRSDRSRLIISYECQPLEDGVHATWYEIYFYKKPYPVVTFEMVKEAIIADINAQTDEKILKGFVWNDKPVWLSSENQFNFKAAYDLAVQTDGANLPVKFKLGETEKGKSIYYTFDNTELLMDFYTKAVGFINSCLNEGWDRKESINWRVIKNKIQQ